VSGGRGNGREGLEDKYLSLQSGEGGQNCTRGNTSVSGRTSTDAYGQMRQGHAAIGVAHNRHNVVAPLVSWRSAGPTVMWPGGCSHRLGVRPAQARRPWNSESFTVPTLRACSERHLPMARDPTSCPGQPHRPAGARPRPLVPRQATFASVLQRSPEPRVLGCPTPSRTIQVV
jgi:hypothetical protein